MFFRVNENGIIKRSFLHYTVLHITPLILNQKKKTANVASICSRMPYKHKYTRASYNNNTKTVCNPYHKKKCKTTQCLK